MAYIAPGTPRGAPSLLGDETSQSSSTALHTPGSASSNNTFLMPNSPVKLRMPPDIYRPRITRTVGQRPACLVNASVTYCGNDQIYAFGGFDQFTDEVYNHVLKLDLVGLQWTLVDNFGDIPGVRMGHTATLYQHDKLLIFGGENEHRAYLADLIIFDLKTATWTQPAVSGVIPKGRARHASVLFDDKLFIAGGIGGQNNHVLDDICYLDLKTFTWSRVWRFVCRFDHSMYIYADRVWIIGGLSEDMDKTADIWWLDLKGSPAFDTPPQYGSAERQAGSNRASGSPSAAFSMAPPPAVGSTGYAANSSSAQVNPPSFHLTSTPPVAPGAISSLRFQSGPNLPAQGSGMHFHAYTSGTLLDFVTPSPTIAPHECSLSALDLDALRWQKLADGREFFRAGYKWHYCVLNEDGTKAWLLGCPSDPAQNDLGPGGFEEHLSDIMEVDLRKYGLLGNNLNPPLRAEASRQPDMHRLIAQPSKGLGADLLELFDKPPESGSGTDFTITALGDSEETDDASGSELTRLSTSPKPIWLDANSPSSPPIHVHKLILKARWPHFARLYASQMAEFHTKRMHIPEPYSVVRSFLRYLYTDSLHVDDCADLSDIAGLLVISNMYGIPHLRLLCINRLSKELDVDHACIIWHSASIASEEWLRKRAAHFCLLHWGRVVRTSGFLKLPRHALVELSQEIDAEGRVVGGDELEIIGGLGGSAFGVGGMTRRVSVSSTRSATADSEVEDNEEMELS